MSRNTPVVAGIIVGLLGVVLVLPILIGGTGSTLFTVVLWALVLTLVALLIFVITDRRQHR